MEATDSQRAERVWVRKREGKKKHLICVTELFGKRRDKKKDPNFKKAPDVQLQTFTFYHTVKVSSDKVVG